MTELENRDFIVLVVEDKRDLRVLHVKVFNRGQQPGKLAEVARSLYEFYLDMRYSHPRQCIHKFVTTDPEPIVSRYAVSK